MTSWYRRRNPVDEEHPVDREIDQRMLNRPEFQQVNARMLELGATFQRLLEGQSKKLWLELESAIHDRWGLLAEEYYNIGFRDGLAKRAADEILGVAEGGELQLTPAEAIGAIATALAIVAKRLV